MVIMKRIVLIFCFLCTCYAGAKAWDFVAPNKYGDTIFYLINNDSASVSVTYKGKDGNDKSAIYDTDTLRIPDTVVWNSKRYTVNNIIPQAFWVSPIKVLYIPKSIRVEYHFDIYPFKLICDSLNEVNIDEENPSIASVDGVVFSKDLKYLIFFPTNKRGYYEVPSTTNTIENLAFFFSSVDSIFIPNSVERIWPMSFSAVKNLRTLRFPNSITHLDGIDLYGLKLEEFVFGSGLQYIGGYDFGNVNSSVLRRVVCLAVTPPQTTITRVYGCDSITLFVPRKSISQYKQAQGWSLFPYIEPIEPPVVSGVNSAEISWVTNAEASSYSLTLYLDAEHARRLLTLTFDDKGYLMNMDINPDAYSQPQSMQRHVRQLAEQQEGEDFNSYFSFTVTGLRASSDYYFVRRTYNAFDEVIDEEQGAFVTLPDTGTGMEQHPSMEVPSASNKLIRDGQLQIRCHDKTYTVQGVETK